MLVTYMHLEIFINLESTKLKHNGIFFKVDNHMTYFRYFVSVFGQKGKKKNFSLLPYYSTNFHAVKCKYLVFLNSEQILKGFVLCAVVFVHNLKQRLSVFARGCVEKYSVHGNSF